jgi:hypothetical protein
VIRAKNPGGAAHAVATTKKKYSAKAIGATTGAFLSLPLIPTALPPLFWAHPGPPFETLSTTYRNVYGLVNRKARGRNPSGLWLFFGGASSLHDRGLSLSL